MKSIESLFHVLRSAKRVAPEGLHPEISFSSWRKLGPPAGYNPSHLLKCKAGFGMGVISNGDMALTPPPTAIPSPSRLIPHFRAGLREKRLRLWKEKQWHGQGSAPPSHASFWAEIIFYCVTLHSFAAATFEEMSLYSAAIKAIFAFNSLFLCYSFRYSARLNSHDSQHVLFKNAKGTFFPLCISREDGRIKRLFLKNKSCCKLNCWEDRNIARNLPITWLLKNQVRDGH